MKDNLFLKFTIWLTVIGAVIALIVVPLPTAEKDGCKVTKCLVSGIGCVGEKVKISDGVYTGNVVTILAIIESDKPYGVTKATVKFCNGKRIMLDSNFDTFEKIETKGNCNVNK